MRIDFAVDFFWARHFSWARHTAAKSATFCPVCERPPAVCRSACRPLAEPRGDPTNWRDPAIGIGRADGFGGPPASGGAQSLVTSDSAQAARGLG
jgi:hypothetical protein